MNSGQCCNPCCPCTSTPIALVVDDPASLIESVLMQSSTYCERDASGKPLIRRNWLHIRQLMTVFKNGCKQESSSNFGKRDSKSSMNCEGSIGTGFRWTEPEPSRH